MAYSITPFLYPYKDKKGLQKVAIRVTYQRMIVYAPTIVKVKIDQFTGQVANHPHAEALNQIGRAHV